LLFVGGSSFSQELLYRILIVGCVKSQRSDNLVSETRGEMK
jgi:hypothetical protein